MTQSCGCKERRLAITSNTACHSLVSEVSSRYQESLLLRTLLSLLYQSEEGGIRVTFRLKKELLLVNRQMEACDWPSLGGEVGMLMLLTKNFFIFWFWFWFYSETELLSFSCTTASFTCNLRMTSLCTLCDTSKRKLKTLSPQGAAINKGSGKNDWDVSPEAEGSHGSGEAPLISTLSSITGQLGTSARR